ncbi:MAG: hypothetical protein RL038_842 [Actinomycetota bacterium]
MALTRVVVGRIGKPHGIRGEVTIEVRTDEPELRFAPGSLVYSEAAPNKSLKVETARWHSGKLLLTFNGVSDRNAAEVVRGTILMSEIDDTELPEAEDEYYDRQLIGLVVEESGKAIGEVTDVLHLPGQEVLVIGLDAGGEMMLPFVEQFVPEVNLAGGFLVITPPAGIVEESDAN